MVTSIYVCNNLMNNSLLSVPGFSIINLYHYAGNGSIHSPGAALKNVEVNDKCDGK